MTPSRINAARSGIGGQFWSSALSIIMPAIKSVFATLAGYRPGRMSSREVSGRGVGSAGAPNAAHASRPVVSGVSQNDEARFWLAAIAESSDDAIVGKNLDGIITSWNKSAEVMFGYTAQEIIGQPVKRIIPFDRIDEETSILSRVRRNEKIVHLETKRQCKDGRIISVSLTVSPIRDDHGKIIGISKTARDLTEIQRVHRDLERREALLRSILDCTPDASIVIDRQGLILSFSLAAQSVFGYTSTDVVGRELGLLLPASDWKRHNSMLAGYSATGDQPITGFGRRKDGSTFPMRLTIGELDLPHMRLFTAFVHDMTDQVARERELRDANIELEHGTRELATERDLADLANRAKSRFVAAIMQDQREPLNGMLAQVERLRADGELNAAQCRYIEALQGSGEHLLQMLDNALDLAETEIEADQVEVPEEDVDVLAIARACLDQIRPAAQEKHLALRIRIAPNVRPNLVTDPARLTQVLNKLLANAVKYTSEGHIELRLRPLANGSTLRIEVADTGQGITTKERRRLFRAYECRDAGVTGADMGAGVGLAVSARLAALLGGCIGHHDNAEGGSVFWLELPADPVGVWIPATRSAGDFAAPSPSALRILLVDDVAMDRDIAACFLAAAGHKVTCAHSGASAIAAVAAGDFDVVLMDVRMPEMDGLEATRRIRALGGAWEYVPIVALTVQTTAQHVAACRDAGMDSHMPKPFDADTLAASVLHANAARISRDDMSAAVSGTAGGVSPGRAPPACNQSAFDRTAFYLTPGSVEAYLDAIAASGVALLRALQEPAALTNARDELAEAAHTIAGSAGLFGFEQLTLACGHFEHAALGAGADLTVLADGLSAALDATIQAILGRTPVMAQA